MSAPTSTPQARTQSVKGDAQLTALIDASGFVRDPRWEAIRQAVQHLSPFDDRCLLAFLLGYKSRDAEFLSLIEEWLKSNDAVNARIAERLKESQ
jgi:hypothetical protein